MKKKHFAIVLCAIAFSSVLASCSCEVNPGNIITKRNINFYVDDQIYYTINTAGNEKLDLPADPSKEGYTFNGWYLDKNYENTFDISYYENHQLVDSINVFAKFLKNDVPTPVKQNINFYVDENIYYTIETAGNEKLTLPEEPTKENHAFNGWYLDKNYEQLFDISYYENHQLVDSIDVFAKFLNTSDLTPIKKVINFYVDDAIYHQLLTNGNEKLTLPEDPVKNGHTFKGWYKDSTFNELFDIKYYEVNELKDSIDVFGKFELNTYKVTFESNGGTIVESFIGTILNEAPITTKNGFDFEGWYLDQDFSNQASFPLTLDSDITLYAKWKEKNVEAKPFEIDSNGKLIKFNLTDTKIVNIPNKVDNIDVLEIDNSLFASNKIIEEVKLPSTLKYLGTSSFKGCINLKKVIFNSDIKRIPSSCFENCTNLNDINLPDSVDSIVMNSFTNSGLTSFKAPNNLYSIGNEAFKDCRKLINLDLTGVHKIYRAAFEGCTSLASVTLPDSLENLNEHYVFYNCTNLENIKMPTKIKSISNTLFNGTKFYKNESNWKNNGLYCDGYLLQGRGDYSVRTFKVEPGTKCVASNIVPDYVEEVSLPEGLEVISYEAFARKSKLSKISISSTVKYVGKDAFMGTLVFKDSKNIVNDVIYLNDWVIGINNVANENTKHLKIKAATKGVASGDLFNYSTRSNLETLTLNEELKYICDAAFKGTDLKEIKFPSTIEYIGYEAFLNTQIKEVTLPIATTIQTNSFNSDTKIVRQ